MSNEKDKNQQESTSNIGRRKVLQSLGGLGLAGMAMTPAGFASASQSSGKRPLEGKVAIVTGARNNLGRGFSVALAEMGANIVIHQHYAKTMEQAKKTAQLCEQHGVRTKIYTADLEPIANVRRMYDVALEEFGRIDIVVNNAGRIKKAPLAEISEEEYDRCAGINNKALFFSMQEAAKRMSDHGRIINIGTSLLSASTPFYSVYAGTKAGMEEYTRMMALEVGKRKITVNVVAPGAIDTPFFHGQETPQTVNYISNATPSKRLGKVSDIVPVVAFLASPESQWMTGQTVWVNDGYTTR